MSGADFHGGQVWLFLNNPHAVSNGGKWGNDTGQLPAYDVLTASNIDSYSVQANATSIGAGDLGVVYRVDGAHAVARRAGDAAASGASAARPSRHIGGIVALAYVTSSPWRGGDGGAYVNWDLIRLAPEYWISSREMADSGLWTNKTPFGTNHQATTPVRQTRDQWQWLQSTFTQRGLPDIASLFHLDLEPDR
ncbi:hypothetical protein GS491_26450 [Rhodococcus hoagii]|nr:hypothetical protein [Prescottella equi]NKR80662.1 hypothetical protein [Prescottella equi]NKS99589.1 hypothetical protein [Prescottella equi]